MIGDVGVPSAKEGGFFDPLNLSEGITDEKLSWYRAAELKHGRVCMVASLGLITQGLFPGLVGNPSFGEANGLTAISKIYTENPAALIQIVVSIAAVEVLCASIDAQGKFERPGDYGWDPAGIRPADEDKLDVMQTKELKNGRLAMLATAGMLYQQSLTGQGVVEQLATGHISPFGDGQGIF
jgi:hypothetical protein